MKKALFSLSIALALTGCAGSVVAIGSDTPKELMAENTEALCYALGGLPSNDMVAAELLRRGAGRPQFIAIARSGIVSLGMNDCEVTAALSGGVFRPSAINRTVIKGLIEEQWVYPATSGWRAHPTTYVYFENGIVTSFQDQR